MTLKKLSYKQLIILYRRMEIKRMFYPGLEFARIGWVRDRVSVEINKRLFYGEQSD